VEGIAKEAYASVHVHWSLVRGYTWEGLTFNKALVSKLVKIVITDIVGSKNLGVLNGIPDSLRL